MKRNYSKDTLSKVLISSVVAVALAVCYILGNIFLYNMQQKTDDLFVRIAQVDRVKNQEADFRALIKDTATDTASLEGAIVSKDGGDIDFIKNLEALGSADHVDFQIVSANETDGQNFNNLVFQVTAQGSWTDTLRMLDIIESLPYKVSLASVSLEAVDGGGSTSKKVVREWRAAIAFSVLKDNK